MMYWIMYISCIRFSKCNVWWGTCHTSCAIYSAICAIATIVHIPRQQFIPLIKKKKKKSGFLVWDCQANIKFCVGRVYMYIYFSGHLVRVELVLLNYLECLIWFKMTYQSLYLQQYLSTLEKVNLLTICIYIHNM